MGIPSLLVDDRAAIIMQDEVRRRVALVRS